MRKLFLMVYLILLCWGLHVGNCFAEPNATAKSSPTDIIHQAIKSGKIADKLTDPDEIKAILGEPQDQKIRRSGGMDLLNISYPDIEMRFFRFRKFEGPFVLTDIKIKGKYIELGGDGILVLRTSQDLKK